MLLLKAALSGVRSRAGHRVTVPVWLAQAPQSADCPAPIQGTHAFLHRAWKMKVRVPVECLTVTNYRLSFCSGRGGRGQRSRCAHAVDACRSCGSWTHTRSDDGYDGYDGSQDPGKGEEDLEALGFGGLTMDSLGFGTHLHHDT